MDYSQQSFTRIYEELISIVEASTTKWSPRNSNESSPGLVILKLLALLEDKFNYKFDMSIAQAYLDTVSNLEQAQELFRMLGYTMKTARAAQGEISISIKEPLEKEEVIQAHSIITNTNKTISFFTIDDVLVPKETPLTASIPVKVMAGKPFKITKNGIESFILKDLDEDGRLTLGKTGLAQNGVFVYTEDDDGTLANDWTYLDLALATPRETKYYTVSTLPSGEGYIQFPPDFETLIKGDGKLSIYGTHTTGSSTNITRNTLSQFEDSTLNPLFLISQKDSFDNGQDSESIQQARTNYYRQIDVCNTLVSGEDFRNAIMSLTTDSGDKLFSSAVTNTSQDRAIRIRSTHKNKNFIHIVPDSDPNKIEVTPLENSSDYIKSFKIAAKEDEETTSSEISGALEKGYKALGTVISATDNTTSSNPRLLAVTTPQMTVRISGYTDAKAYQIRQSIENYFHSRFRADYVEPGQALDYNEIVTAIKKLSPSIQSISMDEPTYQTYKNYRPVDGDEVDSMLAIEDEEIRNNIITRTVLSGDVPLFRYSNRPNTLSKKSSMYTSLLTSQEVIDNNDLEVTTPVPFGYEDETVIVGQGNPAITDFVPMEELTDDDNDGWIKAPLYEGHILQFRRKHYDSTKGYTSGMQYAFYSKRLCTRGEDTLIYTTTTIKANSEFKEASILRTTKTIPLSGTINAYTKDSDSSDWEGPSPIEELLADTSYKLAQDVTILNDLVLSSSSSIALGSIIVPGSTINEDFFQPKILDDPTATDRYELKAEEVLIIATSSGRIEKTLKPGESVSIENIQGGLTVQGPTQQDPPAYQGTLSGIQKILVMESSKCIIDDKYVYLLSIYGEDTLTLNNNNSYMLEEDEFFLYADKSLAEYIVLGPGTVLTSTTSVTLTNRAMTSIEKLNDLSLFNEIKSTITAESYDLTTYRGPNRKVWIHTSNEVLDQPDQGTYKLPITWTSLPKSSNTEALISVYNTENSSEDILINKFSGENYYEVRLVGLLKSDDEGIIHIPQGMSFKLGGKDIGTVNILSTSVPITKLLTKNTGMDLLPPKITSNIKRLTLDNNIYQGDYSVEEHGADNIIIKASISGEASITIPMITSETEGKALANILIELPESNPEGKISITDRYNTEIYIPLLSNPDYKIGDKDLSEFSTIKKTIDLTGLSGFTITLSPEAGEDLTGTIINLTDLSYVTSLSSELSSQEELNEVVTKIRGKVKTADLEFFNWLSYPKEELTNPLVSKNFFNKEHPYNKNTYPYIEYLGQKIKIIGG